MRFGRWEIDAAAFASRLPPPCPLAPTQLYVDCDAEMQALVEGYREEWEVPGLKLAFNVTRGHHLQLPRTIQVSRPIC